jgi:transposase
MTISAQEMPILNREEKSDFIIDQNKQQEWNYEADLFDLSAAWQVLLIRKTANSYEVFADLLTPTPKCPRCGHSDSLSPSGTLVESLIDQSVHFYYLRINFVRQRYKCTCGRNLLQPLADNFKGHSLTKRAAWQITLDSLIHSYEFSANRIGISAKVAKNVFADVICQLEAKRAIAFPETIGIDGVCVGRRKHKRSYCLITDLTNHRVLDLLCKSTELELTRFLKQVPSAENLKVIVIDMAKGFLIVALTLFPDAVIVIDPYHILRLLNDAVTNVVKMKQADLSRLDREGLMQGGNRFLLLKRRSEFTEAEKQQLDLWCNRIPEFKTAFDLKEEVYDIWRIKDRAEAERRYDEWLKKIPHEFDSAFKKFTGAVRRWRKYVFNYFDYRVSNAYTESKNRDIKTLQRQGRRTSFPVLRARLLYADLFLRSHCPLSKSRPSETREVIRKSRKGRKLARERDPESYVARLEDAHKANNEFSRLLRPPHGWEDRFGQYSNRSDEQSRFKWDFLW